MSQPNDNLVWSPLGSLAVGLSMVVALSPVAPIAHAAPPSARGVTLRDLTAANPVNTLKGISAQESSDGSTVLTFEGSREATFNVYRLSDPERLVIDVSNAERGSAPATKAVDSWAIGRIAIGSVDEGGASLARISIDLKRDSSYVVVPRDNKLVVTVTPREAPPEAYFSRKSAAEQKTAIEQLRREAEALKAEAEAQVAAAEAKASAAETRAGQAEVRETKAAAELEKAEKRSATTRVAKRQVEQLRIQLTSATAAAENARGSADLARKQAEVEVKKLKESAAAELLAAKSDSGKAAALKKDALQQRELSASAREAAEATLKEASATKAAASAQSKDVVKQRQLATARSNWASEQAHVAAQLNQAAEVSAKDAEAKLRAAKSALAAAEKERSVAAAERTAAAKSLAEAQSAKDGAKTANKKQKKALDEALADANAAAQSAQERASHADQRVATLEKDRARLKAVLAEQQSMSEELGLVIEAKKSELAKLSSDVEAAKARQSKSSGRKKKDKEAEADLLAAEAKLRAAEAGLAATGDKLTALEAKLSQAEEKLAQTLAQQVLASAPPQAVAPPTAPDAGLQAVTLTQGPPQSEASEPAADSTPTKADRKVPIAKVRDIRYEDGRDSVRVIVDVEGPIVYAGNSMGPRLHSVVLSHASIPSVLERSLDATGFAGPVGMVTSFGEGKEVKIVLSTLDDTPPEITERPGQLVFTFKRKVPRKGNDKTVTTESSFAQSKPVSLPSSQVAGFSSPPVPLANEFGKRSKWRGERIDIELQDAPIKDVLLLFSDIGRVNIIAGQGVDGKVTMRLTAVPWDQALDIILRSLGLGMIQEGNVVRVATLEALEDERNKAIERANAQVQLKPLQTKLIPLSYATVNDMMPKVQSVMSSRGTVTPDTRTNTLIVMDTAENLALAQQLIDQLDSQTPQVLIEARIVEARTNWLRQLGIQWGFDFISSPGTGNPTGLAFPNSLGVGGGSGGAQADTRGLVLPGAAASPNYAVDLPAPVGPGAGGAIGFSFGSISGNLNTNLRLSAAEDAGEVRIISAPKVVTLDNTQAQIEQGVQIPISQVSAQGVNTRYVNATLALRVTPHVTNEGAILLDVQVQKNEADFVNTGARGDPTILTKQAQSQMLINDGDTAVIGGIYTRNTSVNRKKIPWIADVPIIGWFFKNKTQTDTRSEVLIFLTPKIVNRSTSIGGG